MEAISFKVWEKMYVYNSDWFKPPGRLGAFQAGARSRMRNEPYRNIYSRSDMMLAYEEGWDRMDVDLKRGMIIICPCCNHYVRDSSEKETGGVNNANRKNL